MNRKTFLQTAKLGLSSGLIAVVPPFLSNHQYDDLRAQLFAAMRRPVFRKQLLPDPIMVERIEMRRSQGIYFVQVRSTTGQVGMATAKSSLLETLYPIFNIRAKPAFEGQDARDLEDLIQQAYLLGSNYKWQSVPFWICIAVIEFAILDLIGKATGLPLSTLLGDRVRNEMPIYYAMDGRTESPEASVDHLMKLMDKSGSKAVKLRTGARMHFTDASTRRDELLIPLARKRLGDHTTIYADANGSYGVPMALRIGKILQDNGYASFEEPVPFDYYQETLEINQKLNIKVAGGEQERSLRQFMWMIEYGAIDIVMPDPLLFGGLIRSIKVARMAEVAGLETQPHMSGFGLGFLYVLHYASVVPNAGAHLEYKGEKDQIPYHCSTANLKPANGILEIPSGPGLGIEIDPEFVSDSELVE